MNIDAEYAAIPISYSISACNKVSGALQYYWQLEIMQFSQASAYIHKKPHPKVPEEILCLDHSIVAVP
eukprot:14284061-Ditylum_brightwellii.AAC.1